MKPSLTYNRSKSWLIWVLLLQFALLVFFVPSQLGMYIAPLFVLSIIITLLRYKLETIHLGDNAILLKKGILSLKVDEIPYEKINAISIRQSLFGRLMDYGTLQISVGNDSSNMKFKALGQAHRIKKRINILRDR